MYKFGNGKRGGYAIVDSDGKLHSFSATGRYEGLGRISDYNYMDRAIISLLSVNGIVEIFLSPQEKFISPTSFLLVKKLFDSELLTGIPKLYRMGQEDSISYTQIFYPVLPSINYQAVLQKAKEITL